MTPLVRVGEVASNASTKPHYPHGLDLSRERLEPPAISLTSPSSARGFGEDLRCDCLHECGVSWPFSWARKIWVDVTSGPLHRRLAALSLGPAASEDSWSLLPPPWAANLCRAGGSLRSAPQLRSALAYLALRSRPKLK